MLRKKIDWKGVCKRRLHLLAAGAALTLWLIGEASGPVARTLGLEERFSQYFELFETQPQKHGRVATEVLDERIASKTSDRLSLEERIAKKRQREAEALIASPGLPHPDNAARVLELKKSLGIPHQVIENAPEEAEALVRRQEIRAILAKESSLVDWFADPANASLVSDDNRYGLEVYFAALLIASIGISAYRAHLPGSSVRRAFSGVTIPSIKVQVTRTHIAAANFLLGLAVFFLMANDGEHVLSGALIFCTCTVTAVWLYTSRPTG